MMRAVTNRVSLIEYVLKIERVLHKITTQIWSWQDPDTEAKVGLYLGHMDLVEACLLEV